MTTGRIRTLICTALMLISVALSAQSSGNVAYQDGQVRFTVITDGVIRLEWEPEGRFTDLASFVASERDYPEVDYKVKTSGKKVRIQTQKMTLEYKTGSGKFNAGNLVIKANDGFFTWKPGMKQKHNLKGTFRTLDGLDGDVQTQNWVSDMKKGEIRQFEDGILSKDGWTLIDESESYLFDDSEWAWVKERENKECQDWYFMAYGHDYKAALKDFTVCAGKMPLPPRLTFGYWWSRYWAYTDREMRTLVDKFLVVLSAVPSFFLHDLTELVKLIRECILRVSCIEFKSLLLCQLNDLRSKLSRKFTHLSEDHVPCILIDCSPARLSFEKSHEIHQSRILHILAERGHKRRISQTRPYIFDLLEQHHHKLVK